MTNDPLLKIRNLNVTFRTARGRLTAVRNIDFDVFRGETLGIVGESGCGKSSTGRGILALERGARGQALYHNQNLLEMSSNELKPLRKTLQVIFQDPISSLNPRRQIGDSVGEPLRIAGHKDPLAIEARVRTVLAEVGIDPDVAMHKYPSEFSGGQCQRICIARALITEPELVVCDEPVSALDASVQAQVLNLLENMKQRYGLTLVFISHDLAVIRHISDRVMLMYMGSIVEISTAEQFFSRPKHPYAIELLTSLPTLNPKDVRGQGSIFVEPPSPLNPPSGCAYRTRCIHASDVCANQAPLLEKDGDGRLIACHNLVGD